MNLVFHPSAGNQVVTEALVKAFSGGRSPHAILLEGSAGGERDSLARTVARAAVCLSSEENPCGKCAACRKSEAGSHPDILTLNGEENPRAFPIDTIRQLRADAYLKPNEAPNRVFLLLGAQNMPEASQNALLKILEEPPENSLFILTVSGAAALLPTVRSRMQVFTVIGAAPAAGPQAAEIALASAAADEARLLFLTAGLIQDRDLLRDMLAQLSMIFRDAAVLRSGGPGPCLSGQEDAAAALGRDLTRGRLVKLVEATENARRRLELNANAALLVTAYCAALREAAGR